MLGDNVFVQVPHEAVAAQQQGGGNQLVGLLPMLLIFGLVFYFFIIRPQRSRQRKMMEMQSALTPGQRVMTVAGLHATVSAIEDDLIVLEIAPGVLCRYAKQAVTQVLDGGESASDADGETESGDDAEGEAGSTDSSDATEAKDKASDKASDAADDSKTGENSSSSSSSAKGKPSA